MISLIPFISSFYPQNNRNQASDTGIDTPHIPGKLQNQDFIGAVEKAGEAAADLVW